MTAPVLEVQGLKKYFPVSTGGLLHRRTAWVKAVETVDFAIMPGETLGLIGESGCGKTTTAKLILLQEKPTEGSIRFEGEEILGLQGAALMRYRRAVQVVFQDPYSSLSPRMRVRDIIAEPLEIHTDLSRAEIRERVAEVLKLVGMEPDVAELFPHEFSGGQRQRIAIARALVTDTRLIVLDEPVSALDVSIRAQIMNQLEHLQATLGVSYLFIGHDLAGVAHISHRIAVMYLGQLVELAEATELCAHPLHPYTQALLIAALPAHPDDKQERLTISRRDSQRAGAAVRLPLPHALSARDAALRRGGADPQGGRARTTASRAISTIEARTRSRALFASADRDHDVRCLESRVMFSLCPREQPAWDQARVTEALRRMSWRSGTRRSPAKAGICVRAVGRGAEAAARARHPQLGAPLRRELARRALRARAGDQCLRLLPESQWRGYRPPQEPPAPAPGTWGG